MDGMDLDGDMMDNFVDSLVVDPPPAPQHVRWCVLLTTTVNVGVNLTARNRSWSTQWDGFAGQQDDARERRAMYVASLQRWLAGNNLPVIIAENSGERFPELHTMRRRFNKHVELVRLSPSATCAHREIGCHEASAVLRAVNASRLLRLREGTGAREHDLCSHVLMVAGRYYLPGIEGVLRQRCGSHTRVAVQNPRWAPYRDDDDWRQETSAYGFDKRWAPAMFNWSLASRQCQECHASRVVRRMLVSPYQEERLCNLPPMRVAPPVREGSTGILRSSI